MNYQNIDRIKQEETKRTPPARLDDETNISEEDPTWQTLTECQIILPLVLFLKLVPQFTEGLRMALASPKPIVALTYFTNPSKGPTIIDENNLTVTIIVKGKKVPTKIGDSRVNVISRRMCYNLGIREWEPYPFWLQMADTRSVLSTRLIWNLEITIGGHAFRISTVFKDID